MCRLPERKPPVKKGPQGGRYQPYTTDHHKDKRYLLDKKIETGPSGGKFQKYGKGKKRYLLHKG